LNTNREIIPINDIKTATPKIQTSENIQNDIAELFGQQVPFMAVEDTKNQQIIEKLLRIHYSLVRSINILDGNIKTAIEVCNSQGQGKGNCDNYK